MRCRVNDFTAIAKKPVKFGTVLKSVNDVTYLQNYVTHLPATMRNFVRLNLSQEAGAGKLKGLTVSVAPVLIYQGWSACGFSRAKDTPK